MPEGELPLFVYGTLLSGRVRGGLLAHLDRIPATAPGTLYDLPAGYPALAPRGERRVQGELVAAPGARLLAMLDDYEGVGTGLYRRVSTRVRSELGETPAWVYVMDDPRSRGGVPVPSGRWRPGRRR